MSHLLVKDTFDNFLLSEADIKTSCSHSIDGQINEYGWFYVTGGVLDWSYTGLASNEYGWFYVTGGVLDWNYIGLANNEYGWFYISNGVLDWNYTGTASNEYGTWNVVNGQVVF